MQDCSRRARVWCAARRDRDAGTWARLALVRWRMAGAGGNARPPGDGPGVSAAIHTHGTSWCEPLTAASDTPVDRSDAAGRERISMDCFNLGSAGPILNMGPAAVCAGAITRASAAERHAAQVRNAIGIAGRQRPAGPMLAKPRLPGNRKRGAGRLGSA